MAALIFAPISKNKFRPSYKTFFFLIGEKLEGSITLPVTCECRVSVQGVKSLGSHFACQGFDFYEAKKKKKILLLFKKKREILLHFQSFFSEKSSKEQNSTNLNPNLPE